MKLLLIFLLSTSAFSATCVERFALLNRDEKSIWANDKPVQINGKSLTWSMDSEVSIEDSFRVIANDEAALKKLYGNLSYPPEAIKEFGVSPKKSSFQFPKISTKVILERLNLSPKQFEAFGLRSGVPRNQTEYSLLDLKPDFFQKGFFSLVPYSLEKESIRHHLKDTFTEIMSKKGLPVNSHFDLTNFELTHKTYETSPKKYRDLIVNKLHKMVKSPQTHLHVGIPAEVPEAKFYSITRAVETRIVLSLAKDWVEGGADLAYSGGSTLVKSPSEFGESRGVIRAGYRKWKKPHLAHDLEIRNWLTIEEGMENLELVANLATNHKKLHVLEISQSEPLTNEKIGNIFGALDYASKIFELSKDPQLKSMSKDLVRLKALVKKEAPGWEEKISQYLTTHEVVENLNAEAFLKK